MFRVPAHSYEDFVAHLGDREFFGQKLGLERMQKLCERLCHPQNNFKSVHIAGTNGKGSTAAMLASILKKVGYRVGLYTSPHLEDFCERIQINGNRITPEEVLRCSAEVQEVEDKEDPLTFFEMSTAMAFRYFASRNVDFAVIETGLGGRLDATNVILPLVSVITTIGFDHMKFLGNTLQAIAFEKAGMKGGNVEFSKIDPATGTVVEFKGPGGAKVAYDGPHVDMDLALGHDKPHVGWQTGGKRGEGGGLRGNITYDGPQHPSRPSEKR